MRDCWGHHILARNLIVKSLLGHSGCFSTRLEFEASTADSSFSRKLDVVFLQVEASHHKSSRQARQLLYVYTNCLLFKKILISFYTVHASHRLEGIDNRGEITEDGVREALSSKTPPRGKPCEWQWTRTTGAVRQTYRRNVFTPHLPSATCSKSVKRAKIFYRS